MALTLDFQIDPEKINTNRARLLPIDAAGCDARFNVDGIITTSGAKSGRMGMRDYCQAYRNGIIESVESNMLGWNGSKSIPIVTFEQILIEATQNYLYVLQQLEVPLPLVLSVALIGVAGFEIKASQLRQWEPTLIDRDFLMLPDVLIEDYGCDVPRTMRSVFDAVWNGGGWPRSLSYDENGNWKPG